MMSKMGILPYIGFAVAAVIYYRRRTPNHPQPNTDFKTGPECLKIIEGSYHPDGRRNYLSEHDARALENETVERIFGIRNAFTTCDRHEAKRFVQGVTRLMKLTDTGWDGLGRVLYRTAWDTLDMELATGDRTRVNLASVTQVLALKSSLSVFFHMTDKVDNGGLLDLAATIHRTWVDMKREEPDVKDFKDNHDLQNKLSAVFPWRDKILDARSNPLNLILPSFETVWRVALRLFLELHRRDSDNQDDILTLVAFAQKPTDAQFKTEAYENKISAKSLVKEAFRLYPSTRRIRRAYLFSDAENRITCTANVEACQTDPKVWGEDAMEFKPARWKKAGVVQDLAFLACGGRPFLCPASQDFGLRVVGLIAGVLLDIFGDEWGLELDAEEMKGLGSGERLSNDRDAYDGVFANIGELWKDRLE